jgi:hypothetical protein
VGSRTRGPFRRSWPVPGNTVPASGPTYCICGSPIFGGSRIFQFPHAYCRTASATFSPWPSAAITSRRYPDGSFRADLCGEERVVPLMLSASSPAFGSSMGADMASY